MANNKPAISIIVSVYNAGLTLTRCLESLVYQSLENIEIIIVDKASTDNSREIAQLYQTHFPDKVRFFERQYSVNSAAAYNFAAVRAEADYLAFADADDWYELNAMELIYEIINEQAVDMIYYPWKVLDQNGRQIRVSRHPQEETIEAQLLSDQMCTYWCRVFRKSLFCKYLPIPESHASDANFLPVVISNATKIRSLNVALYNYVAGIGISSNVLSSEHLTIRDGWSFLLSHCNSKYSDYIIVFIARRVVNAPKRSWNFKWEYIDWLVKHQDLFLNNALLQEDFKLYQQIKDLILMKKDLIPRIVYINGFGKGSLEQRRQEIQSSAFVGDQGEVIVLNEKNCSLHDNDYLQAAYQAGKNEFLGHYFALKNIYQTGGFFVGDQIHFTATLAPALDKPSVFSFVTSNTFSSEIWGARPGNIVIKELLNTYETPDFYGDFYCPLSERIKNILVARFDVSLNGGAQTKEDACFVADARMFVLNDNNYPHVCEHDFSAHVGESGYKVIPVEIAFPTNLTANQRIRQLTQERNKYHDDLSAIYNSDSWKLIKRLKKFANSFVGRPFKRIFKKMLRIYRKYKYGM